VLLDVEDVGLDAVAGAVALAVRLLAERQDRLGAAEVDDDVAALEPPRDARDELALPVLVLVVDHVALRLADALQDDLLRGLRGDAPEGPAVGLEVQEVAVALVLLASPIAVLVAIEDLEAELVADLGLRIDHPALIDGDLRIGVLDLVDDGHVLEELDLADLLVELRLDLAMGAEHLLCGRLDGGLQRFDQDLALDALVFADLVDHLVETDVHRSNPLPALGRSAFPGFRWAARSTPP